MKHVVHLIALLLTLACAHANPLVIPLWPEGVPGLKPNAGPEGEFNGRFTNVHNPTLTMYAPDVAKATGVAVIVAPGGGYVRVGDGRTDARWLNSIGITAFVLKYRLIEYGHPAPLQDVLRAVRMVRSRADEFGVRADRIGVMGGSAGGHLAGCAATMWDSPEGKTGHARDAVSARPNFAILIYPVVTMETPSVHRGSRYALFGAEPTPEQMESVSLEKNVRSNSPPFFLVATMADASVRVENSLMLYQSLRNAGVPAEMHVYAAGSHGDSRDPQYGPTAKWPARCEEWLRFNKWLPPEQHDFGRWEKDIAAFEASDQTNSPSKGRVVFTGSSTIRMWKSLPQDLPGLQPINRGFGGSDIEDALHFADRIIFPYQPKSVYLRAGGNDLWNGKTPEEVFVHFKEFVETVQKRSPRTEITFISWSPTLARWSQAKREKKLNELVAAYVKSKSRLNYIEAYDVPLGADGKPRAELFLSDKLHFNEAGYKLLAERVRQSVRR
ncbi:MAG TPA: alpha/beta hydrolase fold domain-containing protein [Verrucomicrobiae bacterium]|nr:alpha/beta hydrolase fold domain-containing protein [Verrucomicrobiae bacterium]